MIWNRLHAVILTSSLWGFGFFSLALGDGLGARVDICNPQTEDQVCNTELFGRGESDLQPGIHRCLIQMSGCRRYALIAGKLLQAINTNQAELPPVQQYFLGASLYRLQLSSRSEGVRCEFQIRARDQLEDFLSSVRLKYNKSGGLGAVSLKYIRHAVNMIQSMRNLKNCKERAYSERALAAIAKKYAFDYIEDIFQNIQIADPFSQTGSTDDEITVVMNEIFRDLQRFTSKASELEIATQMVETELRVNEKRLQAILASYDSELYLPSEAGIEVDPITGRVNSPPDSLKLERAYKKSLVFDSAALELKSAKDRAFSGRDQNDYAKLRERYSGLAFSWIAEAAFQDEIRKQTIDSPKWNEVLNSLQESIEPGNPGEVMLHVKRAYKTRYGSRCKTMHERKFKRLWYCR